jgi:UDP-glucose 4-epimerase
MNALITGGAGFIGSHLAEGLLKRGDNVYAIDNLSTGNYGNIKHLLENERFTFVQGSILDKYQTERIVRKVDVIYHFAAAVGVKYIMDNPLASIQCNIHGTESVLELASKWRCKVLIASTSEVYGKNGSFPYKEDGDFLMGATTTTRWSYACTKALDEFLALAYHKEQEVPIVIARFFNVCGPKQTGQYGMVIPRFVKNALSASPLEVYGDGSQSRCFAYVGDVIEAVITLIDTEEAIGQIFNIGCNCEIKIKDLAQKVIDLTGSASEIKYIPYKDVYGEAFEDMMRRVPDISKIRKFIGWEPKVGLDELLLKVMEYERAVIDSTSVIRENPCLSVANKN